MTIRLAKIWQVVDNPGKVKIQKEPTPRLGGLAIFSGVFLSLLFYLILKEGEIGLQVLGVMVGAMAIFLVGLLDDIFELKPLLKFSGQLLAALIPTPFCAIALRKPYVCLCIPAFFLSLYLGRWALSGSRHICFDQSLTQKRIEIFSFSSRHISCASSFLRNRVDMGNHQVLDILFKIESKEVKKQIMTHSGGTYGR